MSDTGPAVTDAALPSHICSQLCIPGTVSGDGTAVQMLDNRTKVADLSPSFEDAASDAVLRVRVHISLNSDLLSGWTSTLGSERR